MNIILTGLYIAALFVFAIIAHEFGHYIAIKKYKITPTLQVNKKHSAWGINLAGMPPHHKLTIYWSGILAGWFPALGIYDIGGWIGLGWFTLIYAVGCKGDLIEIWRIMRFKNGTRN